ncbi:MAG TPA: hypothetical protein P5307_24650, partial [Pirellulaceae bacterium]|nr:hypothetical protein [Pirellulaceae bacterium]
KLLPMHLAGSISREISQLKRTAAGEEWWPMQGRVQRIESLLQYDPTSAEDCAKMESTIRAEVPGAVRNRVERQPVRGEATWMALTFDHSKIVAWFATLREELKTKKPLVEAGRERLALAIAEVEAQANEYFLTDNERRLAAKK